jgi:uncharacterized protein
MLSMAAALLLLGLVAGALTTLAGQGGGLFLLLACSVAIGPREALAITAPALLLGNAHRAFLFRSFIHRPTALRMCLGGLVGAVLGGLLAGVLPPWILQVFLVGLTVLSIAKALRVLKFTVPRAALAPSGFVIGAMTGTAGGAGVLLAPVLLASGLSGRAFVGTSSAIALATHLGRVVSYAGVGLFSRALFLPTLLVSLAIFGGNALGERIRARMSDRAATRLEYGTLVVCVVLSIAGIGK